jgi:hypothetical protein
MPSRTRSGSSPTWPSWIRAYRAHDLAGCAKAALEAVMGNEGRLHRVKGFVLRQPLDGQHLGAIVAHRQRQAGVDAASIEQDRARTALSTVAPFLGASQVQALAQQVEKRDPRVI